MIKELLFGFLLIHSSLAKHVRPGKNKSARPTTVYRLPAIPDPSPNPNPKPSKKWLTLTGAEPLVIAQGGFPGLFPDSSEAGYTAGVAMGVVGTIKYCNLQLTKENLGFCLADMKLENCTNAPLKFPKQQRRYNVNGHDIDGWFSIDFGNDELLKNVQLMQNIFSRSNVFDLVFPIMLPDVVFTIEPQGKLWLNVQNDAFWSQHQLNVIQYIDESKPYFIADYISSPEIGFLKNLGSSTAFDRTKTKLVFRFQSPVEFEPTYKEPYSVLIKKLAMIKTFASGILVPKEYIWPIGKDGYLQPATNLVFEAHKEGLEVYASGFASDIFSSYNYSYDPEAEYLQFVDNSQFSVDGVVTEYPGSASNAIACLATNPNPTTKFGKALIISHNGASIDYPGCTDLAYKKAISDGADIIDCNVQMTKDGVAFCLDSADLLGKTNAAMALMDRSTSIPEVQSKNGIFSFNVRWNEIKSLKPLIQNPFQTGGLYRNPKMKNAGKFMTLPEFLDLAKKNATTGILIGIQHAAYLASKKGLDIIRSVTSALKNVTLDPKQQVLIQSDDTSVLAKFKTIAPAYKRVLLFTQLISDAPKPVVDDIKKYADAVNVGKKSIVQTNSLYLSTGVTKIIEQMHAGNISVYVSGFSTETVSMVLDFYSDPYIELASYTVMGIDAVITDSPKTANAFMRNPCADFFNMELPFVFSPIKPGDYLTQVQLEVVPPAPAPLLPLRVEDVVDPPLPPVNASAGKDSSSTGGGGKDGGGGGGGGAPKSGQSRIAVDVVATTLFLLGLVFVTER